MYYRGCGAHTWTETPGRFFEDKRWTRRRLAHRSDAE